MARKPFFKVLPAFALLAFATSSAAQTAAKLPAAPASGTAASVSEGTPASQTSAHPLSAKELREAQIAADTEKLYVLAQQLKVELDKSSKDTLSLTVVRKAAEIEKLAHSISDRMKSN